MAELKIHVVVPPSSLNWKSPRTLLFSTLKNHLKRDYAPIGHFFVELQVEAPNLHGVRHLITGMSRANAKESEKIVREKKLGLAAFFYDFDGKLDSSADALAELVVARAAGRLKTITATISEAKGQQMMQFIDQWITRGAFRKYGGGVRLHCGEGSGCAEFAVHFLSLLQGTYGSLPEWDRGVWIPKNLMGDEQNKISYAKLFLNGGAWASNENDGRFYRVPDPELVWAWLGKGTEFSWTGKVGGDFTPVSFQNRSEPPEVISSQWQKIKIQ